MSNKVLQMEAHHYIIWSNPIQKYPNIPSKPLRDHYLQSGAVEDGISSKA